jgi:Tol biopolymer transport system component
VGIIPTDSNGGFGRSDIYLAKTTVTKLTGVHGTPEDAGCEAPAWSPDSSTISFNCGHNVNVINADGTGIRLVANEGYASTWSPDGTQIGIQAGPNAWFANADGSGGLTRAADKGWSGWDSPVWRPSRGA